MQFPSNTGGTVLEVVTDNLSVTLEAPVGQPELPNISYARHRNDWVRGDVRSLNCARLIGRLLVHETEPRRVASTGRTR
jgi:hypothetical protein